MTRLWLRGNSLASAMRFHMVWIPQVYCVHVAWHFIQDMCMQWWFKIHENYKQHSAKEQTSMFVTLVGSQQLGFFFFSRRWVSK